MSDAPQLTVQEVPALPPSPKTPPKKSKRAPKEASEVKRKKAPKTEKTATLPEPQTISDLVALPSNVVVNVVKVDPRVETARSGRRTRMAKPGAEGGPKVSEVRSEDIKDKNPLAVRDQLMREYFTLRSHTDEVVQKLCVLVYKNHKE